MGFGSCMSQTPPPRPAIPQGQCNLTSLGLQTSPAQNPCQHAIISTKVKPVIFSPIVDSGTRAENVVETIRPTSAENLDSKSMSKTPVDPKKLKTYLQNCIQNYFLIDGFSNGFHIHYLGPRNFRELKLSSSLIKIPRKLETR
jgi:hypothetical protein